MEVRRRGGKVIVVNPVKETGLQNFRVPSDPVSLLFGSEIASTYVQPHIGGDMAWLLGVAKEVLERGAHDKEFIDKHTEGFEDFQELAKETSWEEIETSSGLKRDEIVDIADQYISAKERRHWLVHGDHASSSRHEERADDCQRFVASRKWLDVEKRA